MARELMSSSRKTLMELVPVSMLNSVVAGTPLMAEENYDSMFPLPIYFVGQDEFFMLTIKGDSMIEAGILAKDL